MTLWRNTAEAPLPQRALHPVQQGIAFDVLDKDLAKGEFVWCADEDDETPDVENDLSWEELRKHPRYLALKEEYSTQTS